MKESRLYSFLDNERGFNLHFIDGSKLLTDLTKIHNIGENAKEYYKNTVLSSLHMITFLKPGESLGVYIDSEDPYFRFKVEMSYSGSMRTLLLPEEFSSFPDKLTGVSRISKIYQGSSPYTSVIEMRGNPTNDIINNILKDSYQTNSKIILNSNSNHAIMLTKLPRKEIKKVVEDEALKISLTDFEIEHRNLLADLFKLEEVDIEDLVEKLESKRFVYLHSKEVKFDCPCSEERMSQNLHTLHANDLDEVFDGKDSIELRCDYCNTIYDIKREELKQ